jgi:hypothetical protein
MPRIFFILGHDRFLPNSMQFTIYYLNNRCCIISILNEKHKKLSKITYTFKDTRGSGVCYCFYAAKAVCWACNCHVSTDNRRGERSISHQQRRHLLGAQPSRQITAQAQNLGHCMRCTPTRAGLKHSDKISPHGSNYTPSLLLRILSAGVMT